MKKVLEEAATRKERKETFRSLVHKSSKGKTFSIYNHNRCDQDQNAN